jgi:hypothetical protein
VRACPGRRRRRGFGLGLSACVAGVDNFFSGEEEGGGFVSFQRLPLPDGTTKTFFFFSFLWSPFLKCRVSNLQISSIMDDKLHSCSKEVLYMTLTS